MRGYDNRTRRTLVLALALGALGGCKQDARAPADAGPPGGSVFFSPQGVAVSERWVLVTNTAHTFDTGASSWGQGFVTVVDRASRQVVSTIETTQKNPGAIAVHGDQAYVVNGGTTVVEDDGMLAVVEGGGIDVIELGAGVPRTVAANIPLGTNPADRRIGSYGAIVVTDDGRYALIGSGTRGDLFKVDLARRQLLRGPKDPIALFGDGARHNGLTVPRRFGAGVAVVNFNSDELCLSDDIAGDLARRSCQAVGVNRELLEGPVDVVADQDGRALVLMTLANALYRLDPAADPPQIDHRFAATGLSTARVLIADGYAYVLNSLSNNLQRVSLADGASRLPFAVLPLRSNPLDMALSTEADGRGYAWVTLFASHQLALIDLEQGEVVELIGPSARPRDLVDGGADALDAGVVDAMPPDVGCDGGAAQPVGVGQIVRVEYGPGAGLGQGELPQVIRGGPQGGSGGGGAVSGVLSLGVGGELVVDFGPYDIVDGPGPDLIVFENPFVVGPYNPFAEPAVVGASATGTAADDFVDFPCDLTQTSGDPQAKRWPYPGCAGVHPVFARAASQCIDPADPTTAGGDAFDLASLGLARARYLRLRDAGISKLGENNKGFDLDAVVLVNWQLR